MANQSMINKNAEYGNINREYIGARYVPKFFQNSQGTAEWVANVPYEALTIVTYLGNSYTSKIPVPSGIGSPNNNPNYWVLSAQFNAQLENIYNEISEINDTINNKYYLLLADSYGENENGWTVKLPVVMQWNSSQYYVAQKGGAGFVIASQGETFQSLFNSVPLSIKQKITDVILITAGNDLVSSVTPTQIATNILSLCYSILNSCEKIVNIFMGGCIARRSPVINKNALIRALNDINGIMKCHSITSAPCFVHSAYYLQDDNIHLIPDGYNNIAYGVKEFIYNHNFYQNIIKQVSSYGSIITETHLTNNMIHVFIHGNIPSISEGTTEILISNLENSDLLGGENEHLGYGSIGNSNISQRGVEIIMKNNKLYCTTLGGALPTTSIPINIYANFYVSAYLY